MIGVLVLKIISFSLAYGKKKVFNTTAKRKSSWPEKSTSYCERLQNTTYNIFEVLKFSFQYLKMASLKQDRDF